MKNKYTAINLGPVVATLSLARKPRGLWSASYIFSYLMECLINHLPQYIEIISPAKISNDQLKKGIGLYPDRLFLKGNLENPSKLIDDAWSQIQKIDEKLDKGYFNIMSATCEAEKDSEAIRILNHRLDVMELFQQAKLEREIAPLLELIGQRIDSSLYEQATGSRFDIDSLGVIAANEFAGSQSWADFKKAMNEEKDQAPYMKLRMPLKSYHKYICIVQADGDNVGKTVTHEDLPDGKVKQISKALLDYATDACTKINEFGALPIYAGGDDLLFISPVVGLGGRTVFDLINDIDQSFSVVKNVVKDCSLKDNPETGGSIEASMSYGISMTYHKFPLYEALEAARGLLFDKAKKVNGKNAIAWNLQKHSGSAFAGMLSKSDKPLYNAFLEVIRHTGDEKTVSAVAHKIRNNGALLGIIASDKEHLDIRLDNLFEKYFDLEDHGSRDYFDSVKMLLKQLLLKYQDNTRKDENWVQTCTQTLYGMLRTAKFIKGEEAKDE